MTVFYIGLCSIGFVVFGFFVWSLCKAAARGDEHLEIGGDWQDPRSNPITDEEVEDRRRQDEAY